MSRSHHPAPSPASNPCSSALRGLDSAPGLQTRALHGNPARPGSPRRHGPLVAPLVQSTSFHQHQVGQPQAHAYSRVSNPTVDEGEAVLGALENAPPAVAFGTGLGAETALFLALLQAGDHVVVGQAVYGGTTRLVRQVLAPLGISSTFVDACNPAAVAAAVTPRTRLVFLETPANPTLQLTDIAAVASALRSLPRAEGSARPLLAVDNTFLTPILQHPLDLGADISVYSTTKLIEGHSVACGGAITSRDEALLDRARWLRKCTGGIQAPFNAWLTSRGIKTLPLRIRAQSQNAARVAHWLHHHPAVTAVHYPGLASHPQFTLAQKQHRESLHGNVIAFEVAGGLEAGRRVLEGTSLCCLAEHVGSVETLLTHPATMTHADVPPAQRRDAGISDALIRLSVGLEDPEDIVADLARAIDASQSVSAHAAVATRPSYLVASTPLVNAGGAL